MIAENGQGPGELDDHVELVAMEHQESASVGHFVDDLALDRDAAELQPGVIPRHLVVVAGHIDDLGAFARLPQDFLHHVVVGLRPVPGPFQPPTVDDVADQI